jgi:AcrR family transcriptional regulator/predicted nucleic acid-binding protein
LSRLVIDASVLVSAPGAKPGSPAGLLMDGARAGVLEMIICEQLMVEVGRTLAEKEYFRDHVTAAEREAYLGLVDALGTRFADPVSPPRLLRDPEDDYLVALAKAAGAAAIVTEDKDLLDHVGLQPPAIKARDACLQLGLIRRRGSSVQGSGAATSHPRRPLHPTYRRLADGPHGMSREDVARNQRARMYGGMIEAIHERGYPQTTVAHVIGIAGVSRRAFYEQFANKEACFLATYDIVVARARKLVLDAWSRERGWANRLHGACKALLDDVASSPKGPRLVLVDSLGVGPKARERMSFAATSFERVVATAFQADPDGDELSPLTVRAIVAGVRHVTFTRMYEHREKELYTLTDEILDWIESYRSPVAKRLNVSALAAPGLVEPRPAAFLAKGDVRARVLSVFVHGALDEGYSELSDRMIAQFAGISTEAFHKLFATKEACFLAVLDEFTAEATATVKTAVERASDWPQAVHMAVGALVEYFAVHEALSGLAFIDIFEVGPSVSDRLTRTIAEFTKLLDDLGPEACRGPLVAREAVTGSMWDIVSSYTAKDRVRELPRLVDQLTFIVLAPYIGPEAAVATILGDG